jgi:hypothetical protein
MQSTISTGGSLLLYAAGRVNRSIAIACVTLIACGRVAFDARGTGGMDADVADVRVADASDASAITGLIAWYPMDDDPQSGTVRDLSPNHLDGACVTDKCPAVANGKIGAAFQFDGSTQHFVVNDARLQQTTGFTATVWVMRSGSEAATALSKPLEHGVGASWELAFEHDGVRFYNTDGTVEDWIEGQPLPIAQWSHIALSWDGTIRRLYVDGSEMASDAKSTIFDSTPLQIGNDREDGVDLTYFAGRLDELRIYDHALAAAEVRQIYESR